MQAEISDSDSNPERSDDASDNEIDHISEQNDHSDIDQAKINERAHAAASNNDNDGLGTGTIPNQDVILPQLPHRKGPEAVAEEGPYLQSEAAIHPQSPAPEPDFQRQRVPGRGSG